MRTGDNDVDELESSENENQLKDLICIWKGKQFLEMNFGVKDRQWEVNFPDFWFTSLYQIEMGGVWRNNRIQGKDAIWSIYILRCLLVTEIDMLSY